MSISTERAAWGSRLGFIFAAVGSAVGLGAIWKFPYVMGQNGGGAFLLVYLGCVMLIGIALLLAEMLLGRMSQRTATSAFRVLKGGAWPIVGMFQVLALYIIVSFYVVVGGWTLAYLVSAFGGSVIPDSSDQAAGRFTAVISNPTQAIAYTLGFLALTAAVVIGGVEKGIERFSKFLMPALFILMLVLMARVLTLPNALEGLWYYLRPDFSKITGKVLIDALGLTFFSLSLGCGMIVAYGSYLTQSHRLVSTSLWVALLASLSGLMAAMIILPAVFAFGMNPNEGPGLTFITMPVIFGQMPFGDVFAVAFFALLLFAALTSSVSLLEGIVGYCIDDWQWSRAKASWLISLAVFALSIPNALSFGVWSTPLLGDKTFFDIMDYVAVNILMPAGGFAVAIFVGWVIWPKVKLELAEECNPLWQQVFRWICAVLAPVVIAVIWYTNL